MSKRKEAKALKYKNEIAALRTLQESLLQKVTQKIDDIEKMADPVQQINGLHKLLLTIQEAKTTVIEERERIAWKQAHEATHGINIWRQLNPSAMDNKRRAVKTQLMLVEKVGEHSFLISQKDRVQKMLGDIQRNCDLHKVAISPVFPDAASLKKFLDCHITLRDRFTIAAFKAAVAPGNLPSPVGGPVKMQPRPKSIAG